MSRLKTVMTDIVNRIDSGAQNEEPIKITNGDLCRWYDQLEIVDVETRRSLEQLGKAKSALESIKGFRDCNLAAEYEHALRDIIRSVTDCAAAALDSLTDEEGKSNG